MPHISAAAQDLELQTRLAQAIVWVRRWCGPHWVLVPVTPGQEGAGARNPTPGDPTSVVIVSDVLVEASRRGNLLPEEVRVIEALGDLDPRLSLVLVVPSLDRPLVGVVRNLGASELVVRREEESVEEESFRLARKLLSPSEQAVLDALPDQLSPGLRISVTQAGCERNRNITEGEFWARRECQLDDVEREFRAAGLPPPAACRSLVRRYVKSRTRGREDARTRGREDARTRGRERRRCRIRRSEASSSPPCRPVVRGGGCQAQP